MQGLLAWIRSLGNAGAVANARALSEQREEERFTVRSLRRRVTGSGPARAA